MQESRYFYTYILTRAASRSQSRKSGKLSEVEIYKCMLGKTEAKVDRICRAKNRESNLVKQIQKSAPRSLKKLNKDGSHL